MDGCQVLRSVFLSVCSSVCSHISETTRPNFTKIFLRTLPAARSSFGGVVIRYVLPVLQIALCCHDVGPMSCPCAFVSGQRMTNGQHYRIGLISGCASGRSLISTIAYCCYQQTDSSGDRRCIITEV